jgi:dTDP-4-amino-4,6-dideoxygalactose transaminase
MGSPQMIPFNRPYVSELDRTYIAAALDSGLLTGDGPFTERASSLLSPLVGGATCQLITSCTHALEMTAILLDLELGDEVILPSFTFVSTANAYALRGAVPVFVDCRPDTLNLDETLIESAITSRTRAIVVVHYAGVACEMDEILEIAERHDLVVIEDNAHGLTGTYRGRPLGSFGTFATQSFHATKNIQCGEGGALVINDETAVARCEILREKGTNRSQFFRGQVDKYRWVDLGSSYLPSDILAAHLTAQLEQIGTIQASRHRVWNRYNEELRAWAEQHSVRLPVVPEHTEHPAHLFQLMMPSAEDRTALLDHLSERGVMGTFHYVPLDTSPAGLRYGRTAEGGCPVTEDVSVRLLRLPLFADLTHDEVGTVVDAVTSFVPR